MVPSVPSAGLLTHGRILRGEIRSRMGEKEKKEVKFLPAAERTKNTTENMYLKRIELYSL